MRKTILLTGGYGFIGSNLLVRLLNENKYRVINVDKLNYASNPKFVFDNVTSIPDDYIFVNTDIINIFGIRDLVQQSDYIIHMAAESSVDKSLSKPYDFLKSNIEGTMNLLEASVNSTRLQKIIHISTDEVHGDTCIRSRELFNERHPLKPNNPYAASKAAGEMLCNAYAHTYKLPIVITRSCNNYGPNQAPDKLMPILINNALNDKPLTICGDGSNIRSWIHVKDKVTAILLLLEEGYIGDTYMIGTRDEISNLEMAEMVLKYIPESKSNIVFIPDRPGNDRRYAVDASKLKTLGWNPTVRFEDGLKQYIDYVKEFGR